MATEVPPTKADEGVDDSPIVVNSERRDSLDKKLQLRPDETDLKNRHILLDNTAAPALQARAAELERQRITDNLKKVHMDVLLSAIITARDCHMYAPWASFC